MTSAFKISTIKREAETYLSQGLYKEALAVYKNFLAKTKGLDPALRKIVDESIDRIRSAAIGNNCEKDVSMSDTMVTVSKPTSKDRAPAGKRLVKAQSLIDAGRYEHALDEYYRLLKNNYLTSAVIKGVALCLVHLVQPKNIAVTVDRLATDLFKHPRNRRTFKRSISNKINQDQYPKHFIALTRNYYLGNGDLS
jgi:tetratricopeptide (TPR) repeat protein